MNLRLCSLPRPEGERRAREGEATSGKPKTKGAKADAGRWTNGTGQTVVIGGQLMPPR